MSIIRNCLTCGKEFRTFPWLIKTGGGKYCSRKCYWESRKEKQGNRLGAKLTKEHKRKISKAIKGQFLGKNHPQWKGGKKKNYDYILIYKPDHPFTECKGYIREHRLVMEQILSRYLDPKEVVHHINGIRYDNRIENLKLFANHSEHMTFHNNIS